MKALLEKILRSRKFLLATLTAAFIALNNALKLGIDEATINHVVIVVVGWILGESVIDASAALKPIKETKPAA